MEINQESFNLAMRAGEVRYPYDCEFIQTIARERLGIEMTLREAERIWQSYSDDRDAGWLSVAADSGEEIVDAIRGYILNVFQKYGYDQTNTGN